MRRRSVSALVRMMACSLSGSRLSSVRFYARHNNLHARMHLKCRLQMVDSLARPQWVIVMSSDIRVYVCEPPHIHRNLVLWNCMLLNLDAILGRWGRRGDCRVDDGVLVGVNSTAIGAAPGTLTVAAGAYPSIWSNRLFTVSLPPAILCIYTWYAIALSITCFRYLIKRTIFVSVVICWLWMHVHRTEKLPQKNKGNPVNLCAYFVWYIPWKSILTTWNSCSWNNTSIN